MCHNHGAWALETVLRNKRAIQGIRSDTVPEELRTEVRDTIQEAVIKTMPKKKKCKKAKWLSEEALLWKQEKPVPMDIINGQYWNQID